MGLMEGSQTQRNKNEMILGILKVFNDMYNNEYEMNVNNDSRILK